MSISGKGGVGKSLVAGNIGYQLAEKGKKVALLDVDYSNPNLGELIGVEEGITLAEGELKFQPITLNNNIQFFSMAGLSRGKPVSMDGSMYAQILRDILNQQWNCEYGVLDMPAGIADQFLEVINVFAKDLLGSIVVVQPAHLKSARKILQLHKNEGVPVLGLIQNMTFFKCPHCGEKHYIFGEAPVDSLALEYDVPLLGSIPLSMEIRQRLEQGQVTIPEYVKCPICGDIVKGQGRHGHFKSAHPELEYTPSDWEQGPIKQAVNTILRSKPLGISYANMIKEKLKGIARNILFLLFARIVEASNEALNIEEIQRKHGFPGDRVIELDITGKDMRTAKVQLFLRLENGVWKLIRLKDDESVARFKDKIDPQKYDEVSIWEKALVWAIVGYRTDTGVPYTAMDVLLSGKVKFDSNQAGTQRAVKVLVDILYKVRETKQIQRIIPALEKVA